MSSITTLTGLAHAVGRSRTAVRAWLARDDWPFSRRPPWPADQIEEIRTWTVLTLQENRNVEGLSGAGPAADPGTDDGVLPDECAAPAPRRTLLQFAQGSDMTASWLQIMPPRPRYRQAFAALTPANLDVLADQMNHGLVFVLHVLHHFDPKERHTDDEWRVLLNWALDHEITMGRLADFWGIQLCEMLEKRGLLPRRRVRRKAARR